MDATNNLAHLPCGQNEVDVIDICGAIADVQKRYFSTPHDGAKQYAQNFISDEASKTSHTGLRSKDSPGVDRVFWMS